MEGQGDTSDSDNEVEIIAETDADRRRTLLDSDKSSGGLSTKHWKSIRDEFQLANDDITEIFTTDDNDDEQRDRHDPRCDIPQSSGSVFTTGDTYPSFGPSSKGKEKENGETLSISSTSRPEKPFRRGKMVQSELNFSRKEPCDGTTDGSARAKPLCVTPSPYNEPPLWICLVCTLYVHRSRQTLPAKVLNC